MELLGVSPRSGHYARLRLNEFSFEQSSALKPSGDCLLQFVRRHSQKSRICTLLAPNYLYTPSPFPSLELPTAPDIIDHESATMTQKYNSMFQPIDPGTPPPWNEVASNSDTEMTMDDAQGMTESETVMTDSQDLEQPREDDDSMKRDVVSNVNENRIIIAIDFGTTFSSVAYTTLPKGTQPEHIGWRRIKCIGNYPGYQPIPGGPMDFRHDVPSELWYDDGTQQDRSRDSANSNFPISENPENETGNVSSSDDDDSSSERPQSEEDDGLELCVRNRGKTPRLRLTTQHWGYDVQRKLNAGNIHRDDAKPLARFKLPLDPNEHTKDVCAEVRVTVESLIKRKIIADETDIYSDYLMHLLEHTKNQLLASEELCQHMLMQFVLCVPAKWPIRGCRTMQLALESAIARTSMDEFAIDGEHDTFMISEPEAAAECILAEANSELQVRLIAHAP